MKNVLVLFGGKSSEHDISLITANLCLNAIDEEEYKIYMEQNPNTKNEMNELEIFRKELENEQNNQIFDEKFLPKEE